jgi:CheY-like chemotaxis protein
VTPDGTARTAPPVAKVVVQNTNGEVIEFYREIVSKLRPLVGNLSKDSEAKAEALLLTKHLSEKSLSLGTHPAGRMAKALEGMMRDVAQRDTEIDASAMKTLTQAIDTLARILEPSILEKCGDLPSPSVLAIDDDSDFLPAMVAALEFARLPATGCGDAIQGLTLLGESRFDLIVLDLGLPDVDGLDVCEAVRKLPSHADTPILILTGRDNIESRAQSSIRGSSDFLSKPCNLFELALRAYTWVYKHQLGLN